jgi:hypothetical protein
MGQSPRKRQKQCPLEVDLHHYLENHSSVSHLKKLSSLTNLSEKTGFLLYEFTFDKSMMKV